MPNASTLHLTENGTNRRCPLCSEIHDVGALSARLALYRARDERILVETSNFVLLRDIAPLVAGHSLLMPRAHVYSLAGLSDELWSEFREAYVMAVHELRKRTGFATVAGFEHGSHQTSRFAGACIDHAHLHLLPLPEPFSRPPARHWLEAYGEVRDAATLRDAARLGDTTKAGYLLFCHEDGGAMVTTSLFEPVPSQYLRRSFARYLGQAHWNWKAVFSDEQPSSNMVSR